MEARGRASTYLAREHRESFARTFVPLGQRNRRYPQGSVQPRQTRLTRRGAGLVWHSPFAWLWSVETSPTPAPASPPADRRAPGVQTPQRLSSPLPFLDNSPSPRDGGDRSTRHPGSCEQTTPPSSYPSQP